MRLPFGHPRRGSPARAAEPAHHLLLGFAPGVGKTYAMLRAAHDMRERGVDVAAGWLETHGPTRDGGARRWARAHSGRAPSTTAASSSGTVLDVSRLVLLCPAHHPQRGGTMASMSQPRLQTVGDGGPQSSAQPNPAPARQGDSTLRGADALSARPRRRRAGGERPGAESDPLRHDVLRDLYKKHHWQVSGPTFYSLHLLLDKHHAAQAELVDELAERVQTLGGVAIAMAHDVAEMSKIERPPRGREEVPVQLLAAARRARAHPGGGTRGRPRRGAADRGDDGTNDLLVSDVNPHERDAGVVPVRAPRRHAPRAGEIATGGEGALRAGARVEAVWASRAARAPATPLKQ